MCAGFSLRGAWGIRRPAKAPVTGTGGPHAHARRALPFPPTHLMAMSPFEVTVVATELSPPPGRLS